MRRRLLIFFLIGLINFVSLASVQAQGTDVFYQSVSDTLTYQTDIVLENLVYSGKTRVSTQMQIYSLLENQISDDENQLMIKLEFKDIQLGDYSRELQILDSSSHKSSMRDFKELELVLKDDVLHKWNNFIINDKGIILERYYSVDLNNVDFFDLTRFVELFFIPLPETELKIGQSWVDAYTSFLPPYDQTNPLVGVITYTYLGQEEFAGIMSNKFKTVIHIEDERYVADDKGMTKVSWVSLGTVYMAAEGNYLVASDQTTDISMLLEVNNQNQDELRNYLQSGIQYSIRLISSKEDSSHI